MRFIRVWYFFEGNNIRVREGSLGVGLHVEGNAFVVETHLKADNVILTQKEDWEEVVQDSKKYLILDTRFRQIVTEDYLGEWDEIFEL